MFLVFVDNKYVKFFCFLWGKLINKVLYLIVNNRGMVILD